jgi:flagellar basal-body rod modification protein FlgD
MATSPTSAVNAANNIGIQDFLRILSSQLTNQDPLQPLDNQQFLSQIAQFSSLQQSQLLNSKIDNLLTTQSAIQSIGVLGKQVTYTNANGVAASGTVSGLAIVNNPQAANNGQLSLSITPVVGPTVSGISFSQITSIR